MIQLKYFNQPWGGWKFTRNWTLRNHAPYLAHPISGNIGLRPYFLYFDLYTLISCSENNKTNSWTLESLNYFWTLMKTVPLTMEDGRSTSVCSLYGQLSQDRMTNFPAFIASKSFDLWNHHIPQMKWYNLRHILMY